MNLLTKVIADGFIKECMNSGVDSSQACKHKRFGSPHVTRAVREYITTWNDRQAVDAMRSEDDRKAFDRFLQGLPLVHGLAIEQTHLGSRLRRGYRAYNTHTRMVVYEVLEQDIPEEYRDDEDLAMGYVSCSAQHARDILGMTVERLSA